MIFIFALIFVTVNLLYWVFVFSALSSYRQSRRKDHGTEELSERSAVIIPVRYESDLSASCISSFAEQYPQTHELLIVDDHAGIDSICQDFISKLYLNRADQQSLDSTEAGFPIIRVIKNGYRQGKKYALSYGIGQTERELIVFTDSDCYAASSKWLLKIIAPFKNENIDIVLGYSPYISRNLLGLFIRFETFMAALQYFSYALRGMPYMGVGRNMAFRKSLFLTNRGFDSHLDLISGSDDLFVSEAAHSGNVAIEINPDSFVYTYPPESLKDFIKQKTRHISTSFRYHWKHKILLGLYSMSHSAFYLFSMVLLFSGEIRIALSLLLLRYLIIALVSFRSFERLEEKKLFYLFPFLDFLMFIYYIIMPFFYFFYDKKRWK